MVESPLVSTLLPTYNRSEYVTGTIESVLEQTYGNVEVVVVNDGSVDDTADVLAEYHDDDRVVVRHNDQNRGISYSLNRAADAASGEYLGFIGDDDRWHEDKLSVQVPRLRQLNNDYCGVFSNATIIDEKGNEIGTAETGWTDAEIHPRILLYCEVVPHPSVLLRKECFEEVGGFDTDFPRAVDWDLWIRLGKHYKFEHIDQELLTVMRIGDNISQSEGHERQARTLIWEKYQEEFEEHPDIATNFEVLLNRNNGVHHLENGRQRQALKHFWTAVRAKPVAHNFVYLTLGMLGPTAYGTAKQVKHRSSTVNRLVKFLRRWEE